MAIMAKKAHVLAGGVQTDITLYSTLGEVQNMGVAFVVDGVTCYAKYGAINDPMATKAKMVKNGGGGGAQALLSVAQPPYGSILYNTVGSSTFTVPAGITRLRISGCASRGLNGSDVRLPDWVSQAPTRFQWFYGGIGGLGARVYQRVFSVSSGAVITVLLGGQGAAASFGSYLTLPCGGHGGNASGSKISNGRNGEPGTNASPQETSDGHDEVHFFIEWGGGI